MACFPVFLFMMQNQLLFFVKNIGSLSSGVFLK